uniref:Uncharacterized protein n=1 Tax=Meloidogyne incognita TaxID=6306 RepID=A0A914KIN2_MELIC
MASSSSGGGGGGGISRFRIIPVNSNYYKKGRWQVWDYYNEGIVDKKTTNTNNILQPKENKIEKESEEEQKKENVNSPKIGNTSFNYEKESKTNPPPPSILSLQNIPTSTSQKLMPRRNSFQLITIKTLEDKNSLNSVPSSISEERLNLIGVNDNTKENNLIKNWIKQQNSSEFITFPPPYQNNKTPQIVEEPPQKLSEFPSSPLLNNYQPISIESTTTTNLISTISSPSPNSLSPNIKSISTSPPPPPKQMFIQPPPPSSLERQLSVGLNEKEIKENNNSSPQQYFSASFGPGQIQFNGNMNGVGGQNYVEERRRSIARRNAIADCLKTTSNTSNICSSSELDCCWLQSLELFVGHPTTESPLHLFFNQQQKIGSSASTGAVPSTIQQQKVDAGVNIDYKIEQAMDLVKTHLIYAVRDEIELLKSRIVELESNVFHLETENAKLREHIPKEVLANICFDNIQQQFNKQKILFSINNIASNK